MYGDLMLGSSLIEAVKDLVKRVEALEAELAKLKAEERR